MTSIEEHINIIKELEEDINEKIRSKIMLRRQKIIGFSTSEGSNNCLALFLHKKNLIPPGFNVNHLWFTSERRAREKFPFDFPKKRKIFELLLKQENLRQKLCYGKSKDLEFVEDAIKTFFQIKAIIEAELGEEI